MHPRNTKIESPLKLHIFKWISNYYYFMICSILFASKLVIAFYCRQHFYLDLLPHEFPNWFCFRFCCCFYSFWTKAMRNTPFSHKGSSQMCDTKIIVLLAAFCVLVKLLEKSFSILSFTLFSFLLAYDVSANTWDGCRICVTNAFTNFDTVLCTWQYIKWSHMYILWSILGSLFN